jgi:hypothetical protein
VFSGEPSTGGENESFRCVTTGRAITYGGVFNRAGGGRIGVPFPTRKASLKLKLKKKSDCLLADGTK